MCFDIYKFSIENDLKNEKFSCILNFKYKVVIMATLAILSTHKFAGCAYDFVTFSSAKNFLIYFLPKKIYSRCQFHQQFRSRFFVQKYNERHISIYSLAMLIFGKIILAQKELVKCWWNRLQHLTTIAGVVALFLVVDN